MKIRHDRETAPEPEGMTAAKTAGTGGAGEPGEERIDPGLIKLAAVLLVGSIAALLDTTIVNVAIHTIGRDLHAPLAEVQWVMTG